MSTERLRGVHGVSTGRPRSVHGASTERPRSVHGASTERPRGVYGASMGHPRSVLEASTGRPWSVQLTPDAKARPLRHYPLSIRSLPVLPRGRSLAALMSWSLWPQSPGILEHASGVATGISSPPMRLVYILPTSIMKLSEDSTVVAAAPRRLQLTLMLTEVSW